MLRFGTDFGEARCFRYSIISQKSILCFSLQRCQSSASVGLRTTEVRRHVNYYGFHKNLENVLHITQQLDGSARRTQTRDMAK
jgi:hypothetical protein